MYEEVLIAGFGGQGIIFAGRLLSEAALEEGWQVACAVSYGPEMRGGTANSSVIISDSPIGSLMVTRPTVAIIMSEPSMAKFEPRVAPGGLLIADRSLVAARSRRPDIQAYYIPASRLAHFLGQPTVANVILLGAMLTVRPVVALSAVRLVLPRMFPAEERGLVGVNERGLELGREQGASIVQEVGSWLH